MMVKIIILATVAVGAMGAPVIFPITKNESDRMICSSWMLKTNEKGIVLKNTNTVFKPNVEYSTSSLVGETGDFHITTTDEVFNIEDFYNMMNYDGKFIIWSIDGSFRFYNCMKQSDIIESTTTAFTNKTSVSIDDNDSIDVRGCTNNVDCINIYCKDKVYIPDTLSCYSSKPGKMIGYYINDDHW